MLVTIQYITGFDVVIHDPLFSYNTQCSMQYMPSLIPITGLTHSPTPLPYKTLSLFLRVHSLSWFISPSDFPPFIFPFLLLMSSMLFLMFHK